MQETHHHHLTARSILGNLIPLLGKDNFEPNTTRGINQLNWVFISYWTMHVRECIYTDPNLCSSYTLTIIPMLWRNTTPIITRDKLVITCSTSYSFYPEMILKSITIVCLRAFRTRQLRLVFPWLRPDGEVHKMASPSFLPWQHGLFGFVINQFWSFRGLCLPEDKSPTVAHRGRSSTSKV